MALLVRALTPRFVSPLLPRLIPRWAAKLVLRFAYGNLRGFTERDVDEYWAPTQFPPATLAARAVAHEFDWSPLAPARLARLHSPTLVIVGSRDRMIEPRTAGRLLESHASAKVRVIRGAGHVALEERPDEVNAALLEFLAPLLERRVRQATG